MAIDALTEQQALQLLATYGANPERWPDTAAQELAEAIERYPTVAAMQSKESDLDNFLDQYIAVPTLSADDLLAAVEARLASMSGEVGAVDSAADIGFPTAVKSQATLGWVERLLNGLLDATPPVLTRMAVAALVPLALGMWLGNNTLKTEDNWLEVEQMLFAPGIEELSDG